MRSTKNDLLYHIIQRYDGESIVAAIESVARLTIFPGNPLALALLVPHPIRLTLIAFALRPYYGSVGEPVKFPSGLPPKPPAPGHWGGRTPGFEQPLPKPGEDLDVGPKR